MKPLALFTLLAVSAVALTAVAVCGCGSDPPPLSPAAYQAELLYCVEHATTRAEADTCRRGVDARYGQLDGGAE